MKIRKIVWIPTLVVVVIVATAGILYAIKVSGPYAELHKQYESVCLAESQLVKTLNAYDQFRDTIPEFTDEWSNEMLIRNGQFNEAVSLLEVTWYERTKNYNQAVTTTPKYVRITGNQFRGVKLPEMISLAEGGANDPKQEKIDKLLTKVGVKPTNKGGDTE